MIKRLIILISIIMLLVSVANGQAFRLSKPTINDPENVYEGLASNGVTQIAFQGDSITWFATGGGLSKTADFGKSFSSYYVGDLNMPRGGISALATLDSIIWVAGVFDSTTDLGSQQTGGGLAYSKNNGTSWTYIPQPIDTAAGDYKYQVWNGDTVTFLAVKTPISNTTWDISIDTLNGDTVVYIASWAGGIRRSKDFGNSWESLPLPSDNLDMLLCSDEIDYVINPQDPAQQGNHNHKGFSVISYGDTVWVGTADGVNLGLVEYDDCIRWRHYNAKNSNLAGNFIIALGRQLWRGEETIWVAALTAEGAGETRAACKTTDGGLTWSRTLVGERIYNFAFKDSIVYACTERGLFKSIDGDNWALYKPMVDEKSNDCIFSHDVYAACVDSREDADTTYLWLGTSDGIAKTADDIIHWTIFRKSLSTSLPSQPAIYAYPNPFAPSIHNVLNGDGHVRVQYFLENPATVSLEIYDFSMDLVYESEHHHIIHIGDNSITWNGRNRAGDLVANGAYFCKLTKKEEDKEKSYWTKLIVVK